MYIVNIGEDQVRILGEPHNEEDTNRSRTHSQHVQPDFYSQCYGLVCTLTVGAHEGRYPGGGTAIYGLYRYVPL